MYSPKIKEDLIPKLYRLRAKLRIPMTVLVDEILRPVVNQMHYEEIDADPEFSNYDNQIKFQFPTPMEVATSVSKPRLKKGVYHAG